MQTCQNGNAEGGNTWPENAPSVEIIPTEGLTPTKPFNPAGTRPLPAVSVPSAKVTVPTATATADPDDDPPGMTRESSAFGGVPNGDRVPFRPAAN
jgi:hypothetical protein